MAAPPAREGRRLASAWLLSMCAHAGLVGMGAMLVARSLGPTDAAAAARTILAPAEREVEIELPPMVAGMANVPAESVPAEATPIPRGGGEATPRPDTKRSGRGGDDASDQPAINLADRDDRILLSPDVLSRFDRSQVQRIDTDRDRASMEDRRASREPMELTFLAMGHGKRPERRRPADVDPSAGALGSSIAAREGGALGAAPLPDGIGERARNPGGDTLGGDRSAPGAGVRDGARGDRHHDAADVARGRPLVATGTPSVPANREGKPSDDVDSEQEVATMVQSLVHASTAGGVAGKGRGGQEGPGAPGAGGTSGPGSRAHALGTGVGSGIDVDPRDKRRTEYVRRARSKIDRFWSFPKWAALEGLQGTVIVTFTIQANGAVSAARVTRPSGIPDFDENCRRAVLAAAPFEPLPPELGPSFSWSLPFEAKNPAVRPRDVGGAAER